MKKNKVRRRRRLDFAKIVCERLVNRNKSSYAIVQDEMGYYLIMPKSVYLSVYKKHCDNKKEFMNFVKIQDYYDWKKEVKKAK